MQEKEEKREHHKQHLHYTKMQTQSSNIYDICVVGGGSGGFGAACSAARHGARVVLIEAGNGLGGTSTWAGVNNYEPVAGPTGLPQELCERLQQTPKTVAIQQRSESYSDNRPWGIYDRSDATDYRLSLSRLSGMPIVFEPDAMADLMLTMLSEAGCKVLLNTRFTQVHTQGNRITSITIQGPEGEDTIRAEVFIDATANIYLARAAGCETAIGIETPDVYDEPSAPEKPEMVLNNASLCYRITPLKPGEQPDIQPIPSDVDRDKIRPVTSIRTYANGDRNMNPLHMMTGLEAYELGEKAYEVADKRLQAHWHILQTQYDFEFAPWKLVWISPMLGVRETYRLVGQYVLREQDLDGGLDNPAHNDIIGMSDHAIDFHGARPSRQLPGPYGIPFRCLLPKEIPNLLVACRGASFSSIGASSCRLSRTMMVLGQAAGTAAALFGANAHNPSAEILCNTLRKDGIALDLETGYLDAMTDIQPLEAKQ